MEHETKMKTEILTILVAVIFALQGKCQPHLQDYRPTPEQQRVMDAQNYQFQLQLLVTPAKEAAAQAAAYAAQAAHCNNQAAKEAADYSAQAASYAGEAATHVYYNRVIFEEDVSDAKQAAANAKQAAVQAEIDLADTALESEMERVVAELKAKFTPSISDLEAQISVLKQEVLGLERQRSQLEKEEGQSEKEAAHLRAKQLFQPKDPWRFLDGKVCSAKDESWFHFTGQVLEVKPNGILVHGDFGPPLEAGIGERNYFVDNFPIQTYPVADGEAIAAPMNFVAHYDERAPLYQFTNTTIDMRVNTVRRLDYGKIVSSPPPDLSQKWNNIVIGSSGNPVITKALAENQEQQAKAKNELAGVVSRLAQINSDFEKQKEPITAEFEAKIKDVPNEIAREAKAKEDAKKQAAVEKVVKFNQDQADKGDLFGLLRMGERYRDGDGVEKNLTKARDYLTKAAAAGSPTAADELKLLPAN